MFFPKLDIGGVSPPSFMCPGNGVKDDAYIVVASGKELRMDIRAAIIITALSSSPNGGVHPQELCRENFYLDGRI